MSKELDLSEFDGDLAGIEIDPTELEDHEPEGSLVKCVITDKWYEIENSLFEELREHDEEETGITFLPVSTEKVKSITKFLEEQLKNS